MCALVSSQLQRLCIALVARRRSLEADVCFVIEECSSDGCDVALECGRVRAGGSLEAPVQPLGEAGTFDSTASGCGQCELRRHDERR